VIWRPRRSSDISRFPEIHELQEQLGQLMEHVMSAEDGGVRVPNVDME
jgi:hypothetical protein